MLITANRLRIKDLKRRLAELQKRREKERQRNKPCRAGYFSDDDDEEEQEEHGEKKDTEFKTMNGSSEWQNVDQTNNRSESRLKTGTSGEEPEVNSTVTSRLNFSTLSV